MSFSEKETEKVWVNFGKYQNLVKHASTPPPPTTPPPLNLSSTQTTLSENMTYLVHIGDLWILANAAHCEIFEFLYELAWAHWGNYDFQNLYFDCKVGLRICRRRQKKYEFLENIQNPT